MEARKTERKKKLIALGTHESKFLCPGGEQLYSNKEMRKRIFSTTHFVWL